MKSSEGIYWQVRRVQFSKADGGKMTLCEFEKIIDRIYKNMGYTWVLSNNEIREIYTRIYSAGYKEGYKRGLEKKTEEDKGK